jgi:hypothetical protein
MKELLRFKNEFVAIVLLVVMFMIGKNMVASYSEQTQTVSVKEQDFKNHSDVLNRWQKISADYRKENEKFIFADASDFKHFVDEQAQAQKVDISYVGPSRQDKVYYEEATMILKVMAPYKNLVNFLRLLEARDIIIDRLTIKNSSLKQEGRKGRTIEVAIRVFVPKR